MGILNYLSPALVKADHNIAATYATQYQIGDDVRSIALCLLPIFSYTRNNVFNEAVAVMKNLTCTGAHVDRPFSIEFKERPEAES